MFCGFKIPMEGCQVRLYSNHEPVGKLWGTIIGYGNTPNCSLYLPTGSWCSAKTLKARPLLPSFLATDKTRYSTHISDELGTCAQSDPFFLKFGRLRLRRLNILTMNLLGSYGVQIIFFINLKIASLYLFPALVNNM